MTIEAPHQNARLLDLTSFSFHCTPQHYHTNNEPQPIPNTQIHIRQGSRHQHASHKDKSSHPTSSRHMTVDKAPSILMPPPRSPKICIARGLCKLCGLGDEVVPRSITSSCTCHNPTTLRARLCDHHPDLSRVSHNRVSKAVKSEGPRAMHARSNLAAWRRELFWSATKRLEYLDKGIQVCGDRLKRDRADLTVVRERLRRC